MGLATVCSPHSLVRVPGNFENFTCESVSVHFRAFCIRNVQPFLGGDKEYGEKILSPRYFLLEAIASPLFSGLPYER